MSKEDSLETSYYSKVPKLNGETYEGLPNFRMSEKDLSSTIDLDSEMNNPLLKRYKLKRERKEIILRLALYGFLKDELLGGSCMVSRKDSRLKIPGRYKNNLNQLKENFRNYLNNKILEGRYI